MVKVEIYKQSEGFCGPVSLRMCASFYGVSIGEEEIARLIGVTRKNGCGVDAIVNGAKKLGLQGSFYHDGCSVNNLRKYCNEFPVIVNWTIPTIGNGDLADLDGHYSVATNVSKRRVYIADPLIGDMRTLDIGTFIKLWYDHKHLHPRKSEDFIVNRAIVIKP